MLFGCKTNQYKNKLKTGLWVYNYTIDSIDYYKAKEKYRNNIPVKTWRKYKNKKIEKKERYVGNVCNVTNYFENGKIESKGKVKLIGNIEIDYWTGSYATDKQGKVKSIGNIEIDYWTGSYATDKVGKVKSIRGNSPTIYALKD